MSVRPEARVIHAVRQWLLAQLPATVATVNASRAAVLYSAYLEPFVIPTGAKLIIAPTATTTAATVALTVGTRTAAQLAADINAVLPGVGSADTDGRLKLTSTETPAAVQTSALVLNGSTTNPLFGWDSGGERVVRNRLVAPTWKGISDGWPVGNGPAPDLGPGFWIVISDRASIPVEPAARRDEHQVAASLEIMYRETNISAQRDRSHISDCLQCVRQLLLSTAGRQLGRAAVGDIMWVAEKQALIASTPFSFESPQAKRMNVLFDMATLTISVRVNERPDLS